MNTHQEIPQVSPGRRHLDQPPRRRAVIPTSRTIQQLMAAEQKIGGRARLIGFNLSLVPPRAH